MKPLPDPPIVVLLGVPFHRVTLSETLDYIDALVERRTPGYLASVDLDLAARASEDVELQRFLFEAGVVLAEGTGLMLAAQGLGVNLPERVAGPDLLPKILAHAEARGQRVFFLGATEAVLQDAAAKCAERFPKLTICGACSPPLARLLELDGRRVREARPDLLLVAMGTPMQEKWIYMNYRQLGVPVCLGVGGGLDELAGHKGSSAWLKELGVEKRSMADLTFFVDTFRRERALMRQTASRSQAPASSVAQPEDGGIGHHAWIGRIDAAVIREKLVEAIAPTPARPNVALDCAKITFMDSTGLGLLIKSFRACKAAGGNLVVLRPSPVVEQMLVTMKLDRVLLIARTEAEIAPLLTAHAKAAAAPAPDSAGISHQDDSLRLHLTGEVTATTLDECRTTIIEAWEAAPLAKVLRLDLSRVTFMDSSGLGLLVRCMKLANARPGGMFVLLNPSPNVENVVRLARLDTLMGLPPRA